MKKSFCLQKISCFVAVISFLTLGLPKNTTKDLTYNNATAVSSPTINTGEVTSTPIIEANLPEKPLPIIEEEPTPKTQEITLSFVGDCTLGTDPDFAYKNSLPYVLDKNNGDYSYFFKGVYDILSQDDLTIANLESTLTTAKNPADKEFTFKADPSYVNILLDGSVEVVNLANNHTKDYGTKGYSDTLDTLDDAGVSYYGRDVYLIKEVNGIKIGFIGLTRWDGTSKIKVKIEEAMKYFNEQSVTIKIVTFHWGDERDYSFNADQQSLGHFAIDKGANLVIGHHPHVLQGVEEYKGSYIAYSLGNFVFGGNQNPKDKDTMIFQQTFTITDNTVTDNSVKIIPASLSSKTNINDYQPHPLEGDNAERVIDKINDYSENFVYVLK